MLPVSMTFGVYSATVEVDTLQELCSNELLPLNHKLCPNYVLIQSVVRLLSTVFRGLHSQLNFCGGIYLERRNENARAGDRNKNLDQSYELVIKSKTPAPWNYTACFHGESPICVCHALHLDGCLDCLKASDLIVLLSYLPLEALSIKPIITALNSSQQQRCHPRRSETRTKAFHCVCRWA